MGTVRSVGVVNNLGQWSLVHRNFDQFGGQIDFRVDNDTTVALLGDTGFATLVAAPLIYAGHQFDAELDLYDVQARWMDSDNGRFLTQDPARSDSNLYQYVAGDPNNLVDPDGRIIVTAALALAFGLAARQSFFAAADRYDAAGDIIGLANPTADQVAQANSLLVSAQRFETGGRILGTVAFVAALAPVAAPLYSGTTTFVATAGGGTALQLAAGATVVGVSDKLLLDGITYGSGLDPDAFSRYSNSPGFTALDFAVSIGSAGIFNGGTDVARLLSGGVRGSARNTAFRLFARSGLVEGILPRGLVRAVSNATSVSQFARLRGQVGALRELGVTARADRRAFFAGNQTLFSRSSVLGTADGIVQLTDDSVLSIVLSARARDAAGNLLRIGDAPVVGGTGLRLLAQQRTLSQNLGRSLGRTMVEVGGGAFLNRSLESTLLRLGFTQRSLFIQEFNESLDILSRIFPTR